MIWDLLRIAIGVVVALVLYLAGAAVIRNFAKGQPDPDPEPVELEDVDVRYRCVVCGAQAVLYASPEGELPQPPRHCREEMALVTPIE